MDKRGAELRAEEGRGWLDGEPGRGSRDLAGREVDLGFRHGLQGLVVADRRMLAHLCHRVRHSPLQAVLRDCKLIRKLECVASLAGDEVLLFRCFAVLPLVLDWEVMAPRRGLEVLMRQQLEILHLDQLVWLEVVEIRHRRDLHLLPELANIAFVLLWEMTMRENIQLL